MRYSIDLDESTIRFIDIEALQQHRTRKLQMEVIIKNHFGLGETKKKINNGDVLKRINKSDDTTKLLKQL
jgi:hypothetical protein